MTESSTPAYTTVGVREVYRLGRSMDGWACGTCHRAAFMRKEHRAAYLRFLLHSLVRHGRVPRRIVRTSWRCTVTCTWVPNV